MNMTIRAPPEGEAHLPPASCSSCASWSDTRFNVIVKSRPARDFLIRGKNSLMARINSLQGRIKFPVPVRRELDRKLLYLALHSEPIAALGGPDEQNSGNFAFRDGFARDLPPPAGSHTKPDHP